jgi:hypothetical protein
MSNTEDETTKEQIKHHAVQQKAPRLRLSTAIMLCFTLAALAIGGWGFYTAYQTAKDSAKDGVLLAQDVIAMCERATPAEKKKLGTACGIADKVVEEAPVEASPSALPPEPGPSGPSGAPAPAITEAQLLQIVKKHCSQPGNCQGPGVTSADIDATIARHCANDNCSIPGPSGAPGETVTGPSGAVGSTGPSGPPGPGATEEQIMAGVKAYCEADASNCGREIICPSGEPTALEVRVRPSEEPELEPQWQVIQTCV